jgi:hypothetical protein
VSSGVLYQLIYTGHTTGYERVLKLKDCAQWAMRGEMSAQSDSAHDSGEPDERVGEGTLVCGATAVVQ